MVARIVHADPMCRVCRVAEPGIVATAGPLPPPFRNPYYGGKRSEGGPQGHHWYHGTSFEPDEEHESYNDLVTPEGTNSEYGERAKEHWNTDLGVHFSALHQVAHDHFAGTQGGPSPHSRIAHATLHMRNPKHYDDEDEMAQDAVRWAHGMGHHYLPKNIQAHKAFIHENYEHVNDHDEEEGKNRYYDYHENLGLSGGDRADISDIDLHGPEHHKGESQEKWLGTHPDREDITRGFRQHLQLKGHDGITYGNSYEGPYKHTCAIAFPETPIGIHHWEWLHHDHPQGEPESERHDDPNQLKLFGRRVTAAGPPQLGFEHTETATGGTKRPTEITLHGLHPDTGDEVGFLRYLVPRRKADKIYVDRLEVHPEHRGNGYAGQIMDEMQRRHPKTPIDHGERTDDGKVWWDSYTRGKSVQKGRTMGTKRLASDWSFEHLNIEGPHWRGFGGPADDPRRVMIEYRKHPDNQLEFRGGTMADYNLRKHGPEAVRRVEESALAHHGATEFDPASVPPEKPKPQRRVYYHGTTVPDVTHILPAVKHGGDVVWHSDTDPNYAYASTNLKDAWDYAESAFNHSFGGMSTQGKPSGPPRVYQVRPIGGDHSHVEQDPTWDDRRDKSRGNNESDRRSKHGWEVVREMKMPRNMGKPEDWMPGGERY